MKKLPKILICVSALCGLSVAIASCASPEPKQTAIQSIGDAYPSSGEFSAPSFTPDGETAYFAGGSMPSPPTIMEAHYVGGKWSKAAVSALGAKTSEGAPFISANGKRIVFSSHRPWNGSTAGNSDLWMAKNTGNGWSEPINIGPPVNTSAREYTPVIAANENLYFSSNNDGTGKEGDIYRIFFSKYDNGKYSEPACLSGDLKADYTLFVQYVAPDESFMLLAGEKPGSASKYDIFVSYRINGKWQPAEALNGKVNTEQSETSARICPGLDQLVLIRIVGDKMNVLFYSLADAGIKR